MRTLSKSCQNGTMNWMFNMSIKYLLGYIKKMKEYKEY